jgi:hypothetical protein
VAIKVTVSDFTPISRDYYYDGQIEEEVKAGHVARMRKIIKGHKNLVAKREGTNHSKHLRVDGTIILKWILKK